MQGDTTWPGYFHNAWRGIMKKNRFPAGLTQEEKDKPYAKYFYRTLARIPDNIMQAIQSGPMKPEDALPFERMNDLLQPGYHECETGYCFLPDNSCYVAVLTQMSAVTGEMLDWWFWWHALESLRYKIWYPGSHVSNHSKDPKQLENRSLSSRERYWNNTQYPVEDVGIGLDMLSITFLPPADFGFDTSLFEQAQIATAICARVGSVAKKVLHTDMCHLVRSTADGVEMRSRFWIGRKINLTMLSEKSFAHRLTSTKLIRKISIPGDTPAQMAHHCAQEYNNLAAILPELYRDYGAHN
jgi:hypothetical protein